MICSPPYFPPLRYDITLLLHHHCNHHHPCHHPHHHPEHHPDHHPHHHHQYIMLMIYRCPPPCYLPAPPLTSSLSHSLLTQDPPHSSTRSSQDPHPHLYHDLNPDHVPPHDSNLQFPGLRGFPALPYAPSFAYPAPAATIAAVAAPAALAVAEVA